MKKIFLLLAVYMVSASLFAQNPPATVMTNLGILKVANENNDPAIIFVDGTIKTKDSSAIDLDGKMIITGNFIQDADRPAFVSADYDGDPTNASGITDMESNGTFVFRNDFANGGRTHQITTDLGANVFDRGLRYLAFPHILLETNDTVVVTSYMGIDAKSIDTVSKGRLLLRSEVKNVNGVNKVYDASLRFPYPSATATAGTIAIERNVELYRTNQMNQLYAFASPFTNQRSGYFAGNWVRNPIYDSNGFYVGYPLANAMDKFGKIYIEYYVIDPFEQLLVGQPYLIRYTNSSFVFTDNNLIWTGDSTTILQNTIGTYLFNGYPYNLSQLQGYIPEQILTNEALYSRNLGAVSSSKWIVIGNSYSAPISVEKLINYLQSTGIGFHDNLWFFPAGSQTYTSVKMSQYDANAFPLQYIPSQSIFMLLQTGAGGQLTIDKSLTVQADVTNNLVFDSGTSSYNAPAAGGTPRGNYQPNLLKFKVSPADNPNVFDLAAVFVRPDGSVGNDRYDMQKFTNPDNGAIQLSMRDDANLRQLQLGLPTTAVNAKMSFRPSQYNGNYVLTTFNVESMTTQAVILEDTKTGIFQDLRENPIYEFAAEQYDNEDRFVVHFVPQIPTNTNDLTAGAINAYYNNHSIIVHRLNEKDLNSTIEVIDVQGRVISRAIVTSYPTQSVDGNLASGVYIVRVKGARDYTGKVVVKQ